MAVRVEEYKSSRSVDEQVGRTATVRIFQVDTTPDIALSQIGVPAMGDPLPWDSTQKVANRQSSYLDKSAQTALVTIIYAVGGSWGGANPHDPLFKSWTLDYYDVAVEIPYAYRNPFAYRYRGISGNSVSLDTFPVVGEKHWESRQKFIRDVRITGLNIGQIQLIGALANKLHQINGAWYRFSLAPIHEIAANVWDTTYTWENDTGTPNIYISDNLVHYPNGFASGLGGIAGLFARPPFMAVYPYPGFDPGPPPVPTWPTFKVRFEYDFAVPSSWQTLPGMSL